MKLCNVNLDDACLYDDVIKLNFYKAPLMKIVKCDRKVSNFIFQAEISLDLIFSIAFQIHSFPIVIHMGTFHKLTDYNLVCYHWYYLKMMVITKYNIYKS